MGESLDKYIGFLTDQGSVIRDFLAEPESPDRIRSDLVDIGLTASPDVVDWLTRINGLNKRFRGFLVFADQSPYSFSQALTARRQNLRFAAQDDGPTDHPEPPSEAMYQKAWFPVCGSQPTITVDLNDRSVKELWWDEPPRPRFTTLDEFIAHELQRFADGEIRVAPDGRIAKPNQPDILPEWDGCNGNVLRPRQMPNLDEPQFQGTIPSIVTLRGATRILITGAVQGSIVGNQGMESAQLEKFREYFIGIGIAERSIEVEVAEPTITHVHEIRFFTAD